MGINSVISFPDRGNYGKASWRGNTSGRVVKALLEFFRPSLFADPAEGSGTSRDVAKEMGVEYVGLDLHSGFNLLKDRLLERLPREADYVFFHPPYHNVIRYSGDVWGLDPHPDDLSRCESPEEFLHKLEMALFNIYEATKRGGHYSVQLGDLRKNGNYWSLQSDVIKVAPGKLEGIVIKAQHNCMSDKVNYSGNFIPIMHEYIINFKKDGLVISFLDCALQTSNHLRNLSDASWKAVISWALRELGGKGSLPDIYDAVSKGASEKLNGNSNWQAKVRQVLQKHFSNFERGVWGLKEDNVIKGGERRWIKEKSLSQKQ